LNLQIYVTNVKKIEAELYSDDLIQKYFFFRMCLL